MRAAILLTLLCSFSFFAACNPSENIAEEIIEDAMEDRAGGDAEVKIGNDGAMRVTTDEGTMEIGGQEVPANWPSDAPVYPRARVTYSAAVNPQTGKPGASLMLATEDSGADVEAFYTAQMAANGWANEGTVKSGGLVIVTAKKEGRVFSVIITGDDDKTSVTLAVGEE